MILNSLLFLLLVGLNSALAQGCEQCNKITKLYEELKCTPIYKDGNSCCPSKYDCSHMENRDPNKCYLLGVGYENGPTLPEEFGEPYCNFGCFCEEGNFICAVADCYFEDFQPGCQYKYESDKCCPSGMICPPFEDTCLVDGKYYKENEEFRPASNKSMKCKCFKGFEGKIEHPYCKLDVCLTEMHYTSQIKESCAPIYSTTGNCPNNFLCSIPKNTTMVEGCIETDEYCKVGTDKLKKGDSFTSYTGNGYRTDCECVVPPLASCTQTYIRNK